MRSVMLCMLLGCGPATAPAVDNPLLTEPSRAGCERTATDDIDGDGVEDQVERFRYDGNGRTFEADAENFTTGFSRMDSWTWDGACNTQFLRASDDNGFREFHTLDRACDVNADPLDELYVIETQFPVQPEPAEGARLHTTYTRTYAPNGFTETETVERSDVAAVVLNTYTYDTSDRRMAYTTFSDGVLAGTGDFVWFDALGIDLPGTDTHRTPSGAVHTEFRRTYDDRGRLVEQVHHYANAPDERYTTTWVDDAWIMALEEGYFDDVLAFRRIHACTPDGLDCTNTLEDDEGTTLAVRHTEWVCP